MENTFAEIKLFQVKPDRIEEFEAMAKEMETEQKSRQGCIGIRYMKRFYVLDHFVPRELTRIVKCVKYFSFWEFDTKENYSQAINWYFDAYFKRVGRLLIMPFDINCGYTVGEESGGKSEEAGLL